MPKIIEIMAANESPTHTERWNLSLRIDLLNTQVDEFNRNISESGWITFLHVILCILTLGLFSLKETLQLQKVEPLLGELFPGGKVKWDDRSELAEEEKQKEAGLSEKQKSNTQAATTESLSPDEPKILERNSHTSPATAKTFSHEEIAERWEALAEAAKSCRPEEPSNRILIAVGIVEDA